VTRSVAVIGAGLAGLQVARRLTDAGFDVRLFEKSRGVGGRMSTRRTDRGTFDHGAQYFTARDPRFQKQVEAWRDRGAARAWAGRVVRVSRGGVVDEAREAERFVGAPRMNLVARDLLGEIPIELGVRIETVCREDEGYLLRSEAGEQYAGFDLLVCAVPPAQAVPLLAVAPGFAALAEEVRMLPCHATMLEFEAPIAVDFEGAFVEEDASESLAWIARDDSKPGRPEGTRWVLHARGEWSEAHVYDGSEEVGETLERAFAELLDAPLPPLLSRSTHRWLFARVANGLSGEVRFDPESGVGLCGDWLRGDRVEDAFLSGDHLAEAILDATAPA